jgi:acetylglutamate kinase
VIVHGAQTLKTTATTVIVHGAQTLKTTAQTLKTTAQTLKTTAHAGNTTVIVHGAQTLKTTAQTLKTTAHSGNTTVIVHGAARGKRTRHSKHRAGVDLQVSQALQRSPQHIRSTPEYESWHQVRSMSPREHILPMRVLENTFYLRV